MQDELSATTSVIEDVHMHVCNGITAPCVFVGYKNDVSALTLQKFIANIKCCSTVCVCVSTSFLETLPIKKKRAI